MGLGSPPLEIEIYVWVKPAEFYNVSIEIGRTLESDVVAQAASEKHPGKSRACRFVSQERFVVFLESLKINS